MDTLSSTANNLPKLSSFEKQNEKNYIQNYNKSYEEVQNERGFQTPICGGKELNR